MIIETKFLNLLIICSLCITPNDDDDVRFIVRDGSFGFHVLLLLLLLLLLFKISTYA